MAEIYAEGVLVPQDVPKAVALYEGLLADGRTWAASSLAALYLKGPDNGLDPARAVGYYEQAIAAGDVAAMVSLGNIYRDGKVAPKNIARAAELYQNAYAAGSKNALASAASVLLRGTAAQKRQGHDLIARGQAENAPNISAVLADAVLNGAGTPKSPTKAVAILKAAAKEGDANAASRLIQLYAQGSGKDVKKNLSLAKATLANLESQIPEARRQSEALFIQGATAYSVGQYEAFFKAIEGLRPDTRANLIDRLVGANNNVYAYILQSELKDAGVYDGKLNGVLTSATIKAFNQFCAARNKAAFCMTGPLSRPARNVFCLLYTSPSPRD